MKAALLLLVVLASGCCAVPRLFLEGEEAVYSAVIPRYAAYVMEDQTLTDELRADLLRTTLAWRFSLERAREALDGEGGE